MDKLSTKAVSKKEDDGSDENAEIDRYSIAEIFVVGNIKYEDLQEPV